MMSIFYTMSQAAPLSLQWFLTRECAHAHERVIAIVDFSLGRSVGWFVGWLVGSVVNFRACAVNEF